MRIRVNCDIPLGHTKLFRGQILEVAALPPELRPFLVPCEDGTRRLELLADVEAATVEPGERAVLARPRRRRLA